jgi:hypothetical protein
MINISTDIISYIPFVALNYRILRQIRTWKFYVIILDHLIYNDNIFHLLWLHVYHKSTQATDKGK